MQQLTAVLLLDRKMGARHSSEHVGHLPNADGPFGVGVVDIMFNDALPLSDIEFEQKDPAQTIPPGLFVRLLYPTEHKFAHWPCAHPDDADVVTSPILWMPNDDYLAGLARFVNKPAWMLRLLSSALIGTKYIPAVMNAPLVQQQTDGQLPVVVFSHGLGGNRFINTANMIALATRGFVVAAVEHRDESASFTYRILEDGTKEPINYRRRTPDVPEFPMRNLQVHYRAAECVEALRLLKLINEGAFVKCLSNGVDSLKIGADVDFDSFKDRLNISSASLAGHSFGGATSLIALSRCPQFKCAVALDCWMHSVERDSYSMVQKPVLFLNAWGFQWKENIEKMMQVINADGGEKILFTIKGSEHQSFADTTYFLNGYFGKKMKSRGEIDPYLCGKISDELSAAFIRKHAGLSNDDEMTAAIENNIDHLHQGTNVVWKTDEDASENKSNL